MFQFIELIKFNYFSNYSTLEKYYHWNFDKSTLYSYLCSKKKKPSGGTRLFWGVEGTSLGGKTYWPLLTL